MYYFDTSALVKLIVSEAESTALRSWLAAEPRGGITCDLTRTELVRTVRRRTPELASRAQSVLDDIDVYALPTRLYERAGELNPTVLRSLDAVHLAAALDLGDDLEGLVTYDDRLADAAQSYGMTTLAPR